MDLLKTNLYASIDEMLLKYNDDDYIKQKLENYVCNQLPNILNNLKTNQIERKNRIEEMTNEKELFIQQFLHNNQYFFVSNTNTFFMYDGLHYQIFSEDDILHHVLSSISQDRQLMSWKHKTKVNVMKKIKDNSLLTTIPESDTIQFVLSHLVGNVFPNKETTKYFLCVIGDSLLKKNTHLIHYISSYGKNFIKCLDNVANLLLGGHVNNTIKYKYHHHTYNDFRILQMNETVKQESSWLYLLKSYALDILCVSCHYSQRFDNSDNYIIHHCNNNIVTENVMFVKNTVLDELIQEFINNYFDNTEVKEDSIIKQISWKNVQYLWKLFLNSKNCPSIIFMNDLKNIMIEQLKEEYNEEQDVFINLSSKYLPSIQQFLKFWDNTITINDIEEDHFEIDEIILMFKCWALAEHETHTLLTEQEINDIIQHFYPTVEIINDKYVIGIKCNIWDKKNDIEKSLINLKEELNQSEYTPISIYDAYSYYCKLNTSVPVSNFPKLIVHKSYFEKYIFEQYSEYIQDNKWLIVDWLFT
tara:strand:+ start:676 stop:2262 length:1587 start_codon:yes stop_codon:yes gene_type:complete